MYTGRQWAFVVVACYCVAVCACEPRVNVTVDCEALWAILRDQTPETTGMRMDGAGACFERPLLAAARSVLELSGVAVEKAGGGQVRILASGAQVGELVAWSVTGRACAREGSGEKDISVLEFDAEGRRFVPRKPRCEFERSLYSTMLLLTVVLVVFLVLRPGDEDKKEKDADADKESNDIQSTSLFRASGHFGEELRFRALRT